LLVEDGGEDEGTEEIIHVLAHIPGLKVIARTSAFAFKGKNEDVRRIAETLRVAHILEGGVRRAGNRIRVTAQLIAAADGSHLWSERYDREMADVFEIQGRFRESVTEMRRAVEQDPLNVSWRSILGSHLDLSGMHDQAQEEVLKALEIDENHWLPNCILGQIYMATGRYTEAVAAAEKADLFNPMHSMPAAILAAALVQVGEKDRAVDVFREMGDSPKPLWGRVEYHLYRSDIDAAADWCEKMIEQREPFALIYACSSLCKDLRQSPLWPALTRKMNLPAVAP